MKTDTDPHQGTSLKFQNTKTKKRSNKFPKRRSKQKIHVSLELPNSNRGQVEKKLFPHNSEEKDSQSRISLTQTIVITYEDREKRHFDMERL